MMKEIYILYFMKSILQSIIFFLKDLAILNSRVTIHIFNDLLRFLNFWKTFHDNYLLTESLKISILKYEDISIWYKNDKILYFKKMIFYMNFIINLMLFRLLKVNDIFWNTINNILFWKSDFVIICILNEIADQ